MKSNNIFATVFIPTYNGEEYLEDLLKMVFSQKLDRKFEVLVIDSGSTDNTLNIVKKFKEVNLIEIPNEDFGHGKTRNLAAKKAKGDYMVYLSQDAVPAHNKWLEFMIEPFFINDQVYCVFGKQIPRPFADATTKREVSSVFNSLGPEHSIMINRQFSLLTGVESKPYLTFFSDVNSAVRRDYILNKIPYRDVRYSEDQLLGSDVLKNKYLKAYSPMGSVFHSNEYSTSDYFLRKFDEYIGMYETLGVLPPHGIRTHINRLLGDIAKDWVFIINDKEYNKKNKIINIFQSILRNLYREKAAFLASSPKYRKKYSSKFSLEFKYKPKSED